MREYPYKSIDQSLVFRETFNSEAEVRRNGGNITGSPTITDGYFLNNSLADFVKYENTLDLVKI